jgi:hypothetical protein
MKYLFFIILIVIVIVCLIISSPKTNEKFAAGLKPQQPEIDSVEHILPNTLKISWKRPISPGDDPINGYLIMIKKANDTNGSYLKLYGNKDCINCVYEIKNLNLESEKLYHVSLIAINKAGTSLPANKFEIKTKRMSNAPSSSSDTPTGSSDTPLPTAIFEEDRIKMAQAARKKNIEGELHNMVARAEGVFEWNKDKLEYPNTFSQTLSDSIKTPNEQMLKDIQEYKLYINFEGGSGGKESTPTTPSST